MLKFRLLLLLIPIGMVFPSVDADASRSPSRFCTPAEKDCRLSSWLAPAQNAQKGVVQDQDQDDVLTSEPIAKTLTGVESKIKIQEVAVEPRKPSLPVASESKIKPQPSHGKTTSVEIKKPALTPVATPLPIPTSPQQENDPALKSKTETPPVVRSAPKVQPLSLTGPPPFDAATGNLNVEGLNIRTGREPIDELLTVSNGSGPLARSSQSTLAAAPQSSWVQKLGWLDTPNITVGTRIWLTQGNFGFNFGNASINPLSELLWKGTDAKVYEVKADLVVRRFVSTVTLGWGKISRGTLDDYDFAATNRTCIPAVDPVDGLCSRTNTGQVEGYVLHGSVDIGPRIVQWKYKDQPGAVDLLFGYQFWREKMTARGFSYNHCRLADGFDCRIQGNPSNAVTETITWQSFRLGPRVTVPLPARFAVVGQLLYIPWNNHENEDIHHLREDISQSPSFIQKAAKGHGIQLEGALQYRPWRRLLLEAGYRYWDMESGGGDSLVVVPCTISGQGGIRNCTQANGQLNDAKARRQGIFFGLGWTF